MGSEMCIRDSFWGALDVDCKEALDVACWGAMDVDCYGSVGC